jgi:hypothetical protein
MMSGLTAAKAHGGTRLSIIARVLVPAIERAGTPARIMWWAGSDTPEGAAPSFWLDGRAPAARETRAAPSSRSWSASVRSASEPGLMLASALPAEMSGLNHGVFADRRRWRGATVSVSKEGVARRRPSAVVTGPPRPGLPANLSSRWCPTVTAGRRVLVGTGPRRDQEGGGDAGFAGLPMRCRPAAASRRLPRAAT